METKDLKIQNYNEQEIAEHYIGVIKQKRAQGFTDEQIAKDIGFPLETVQRVNTNDTLPDNPNEDGEDVLPREMGSGEVEGIQNTEESSSRSESNNTEEQVDTPNQIHGEDNIQESESKEDTQEIREEQKENMGSSNSDEDKIDVKEEYTLEQSAEDMFSDDAFKQLKAEFAQTKIRHSKLFNHIGKVMTGEEEDVMPVEMLQIKADAMQVYLTVLGVQMNMVKRMEKEIKNNEEDK